LFAPGGKPKDEWAGGLEAALPGSASSANLMEIGWLCALGNEQVPVALRMGEIRGQDNLILYHVVHE